MISICFVCHGNICRSPMAEMIFEHLLCQNGIGGSFSVCSRATSSEEIFCGRGNPIYPPARQELEKHGINVKDDKRATQLVKGDYERFDLLIGMDSANIRNMLRLFGGDNDGKIKKLLEYTGESRDVSDPWYSGRFDVAYRDIYSGCVQLLKLLTEKSH